MKINQDMKAKKTGTNEMAQENIILLMEIYTMGNGLMINLMELDSIIKIFN